MPTRSCYYSPVSQNKPPNWYYPVIHAYHQITSLLSISLWLLQGHGQSDTQPFGVCYTLPRIPSLCAFFAVAYAIRNVLCSSFPHMAILFLKTHLKCCSLHVSFFTHHLVVAVWLFSRFLSMDRTLTVACGVPYIGSANLQFSFSPKTGPVK